MHCQMELLLVVGKILENNRDLNRQLLRYEQQLLPHTARTLQQNGAPRIYDAHSHARQDIEQPRSVTAEQLGSMAKTFMMLRHLGFERELEKSKPYQKVNRNVIDNSFTSSFLGSHAWTALSDISMAEISAVSVVALPIDWTAISNAYHYPRTQAIGSRLDLTKTTLADVGMTPYGAQGPVGRRTASPKMQQYSIVLLGGSEVDKEALALQVRMALRNWETALTLIIEVFGSAPT